VNFEPPYLAGNLINGSSYRYGFNGKENDLEYGGGGLTQNYGFRMYNPALGRFLSEDPLTKSYPWYTPYQFAGNMPIWAIDLDGLEEYIVHRDRSKDGRSIKVTVVYVKPNDRKDSKPGANDKNRKADYYYDNGPAIPMKSWASPSAAEAYVEVSKKKIYTNEWRLDNRLPEERLLKDGQGLIKGRNDDGSLQRWDGMEGNVEVPGSVEFFSETSESKSLIQGQSLKELTLVLLRNPELKITVTGNTSRAGDDNQNLSENRAKDLINDIVNMAVSLGATEEQVKTLRLNATAVGNADNRAKDRGSEAGSDKSTDKSTVVTIDS
jgi:RHS repeat-associated protein